MPNSQQSTAKTLSRRARWIERGAMLALAIASLAWSAWFWRDLAQVPGVDWVVARTVSQITAAQDRALAAEGETALFTRLEARLSDEPRDWVVIAALTTLASAQGLTLPADLEARRAALDAQDNGWIASGLSCGACAWDLRQCDLSATLACGVAVNLTPLGDLVALTREGANYVAGSPVDQVDVGLAFVGLAATGLVLASGGSSLTVKAGASLLRVAHRTGRLAPEVLTVFRRAFSSGIDWARLPAVRGADDLAALARPAVLGPAIDLAQDLGRLNARLGTSQALHLLGALDTPADVARATRTAEALGPRTLGTFEMLGKSRFLRLGVRLADEVWALVAGVFASLGAMVGLLAPFLARMGRQVGRLALRFTLRVFLR